MRFEGSGAVVWPSRAHYCAECGEQVIHNRGLDDPLELRLVCTVCMMRDAPADLGSLPADGHLGHDLMHCSECYFKMRDRV